mmetsp:Transcript_73899/g.187419  ORF Transcript_73899/g.187419 Transcript_73899/m.187419 type:complete len:209 (+) Transcript_73899:813-1439(+)
MACFTRVKASRRADVAKAESLGSEAASFDNTATACLRAPTPWAANCTKDGALKTLLNKSFASSLDKMPMASATDAISSLRICCLSPHSLSVIAHFVFNSDRKAWSVPRDASRSSRSSFDSASRLSARAMFCCFSFREAWPEAISSSLATLSSSKACWFANSSFWDSERSASKVVFICFKMPKISEEAGWYGAALPPPAPCTNAANARF